jgi:TPR repeat protein
MDDAILAYGKKDYEKAVSIFEPLSSEGNAEAQHRLSIMYANGYGVKK